MSINIPDIFPQNKNNYGSGDNIKCVYCSKFESEYEGVFVKPCGNKNCDVKAHTECVIYQVKVENEVNCVCEYPITRIKKTKTFNYKHFFKQLFKVVYVLLMMIGGTIITFVMGLGGTVDDVLNWCGVERQCDNPMIFTIILTIPFCFLFWQYHWLRWCELGWPQKIGRYDIFCCGVIRDKVKYKSYISMFVMFIISNGLIMIAHIVGHYIIKALWGLDVFFTWRTSLAGYVVYLIVLGCVGMGFGVKFVVGWIKNKYTVVDYEVELDDVDVK